MTVNVGTIGHADHKDRKVAIVGGGRPNLNSALAIALAYGGYIAEPGKAPKPITDIYLTTSDLERIEAAEAKRQRRIERNKQRGMLE